MKSTKKNLKSNAIKMIKNSVYGTFIEKEEVYCSHCLHAIKDYFFNTPLYCRNCTGDGVDSTYENKTFDDYLTKEEMRTYKIDKLNNEQ